MFDVTPAITISELAADLVGLIERRRTGSTRPSIIAVDGWSGSGKTHLADRLAPALGATCVHLDDFVPGWYGLARSVDLLVEWVLEPLAAGQEAGWRRWDWERAEFGTWMTLATPSNPTIVVEGCGAGSAAVLPWLSALVWIDASVDERNRRLRTRDDWVGYEPWFDVWADQERSLRTEDDPVAVADVVVRMKEDRPDQSEVVIASWLA